MKTKRFRVIVKQQYVEQDFYAITGCASDAVLEIFKMLCDYAQRAKFKHLDCPKVGDIFTCNGADYKVSSNWFSDSD